jgi:hypothetical protein
VEIMRCAHLHFIRLRIAIFGRSAFEDVADVDVLAWETGSHEEQVEQLSGPAHERPAGPVLIPSRRLADDGDIGVRMTFAEDDLGS